jgi:predicted RecA/RadA family phage recombinase
MRNFKQKGENLTLPAPYAVSSGDGALVGSIFGIAAGDAANGAEVDLVTVGVFVMPKVSTDVMAVGTPVYWDDTAKLVTITATDNTKIGVSVATAVNPSGTTSVRLNGAF